MIIKQFCFLGLFLLGLVFNAHAQDKYADVLLDSYYSGTNPNFSNFYGSNGAGGIVLVNPDVCLGNTPWFVSLPKGSYVTVGFVDNLIFNAPNQDDIFIQEKGSASELADIFISSDNGLTFTFFGKINGGVTNAIDLEDIGYTGLVNAIKIVGLDNNGFAPGFDVARIYGITGANCSANAEFDLPSVCQDSTLDLTGLAPGTWSGSILQDSQIVTIDTGTFLLTHIVVDEFPICPNDTAIIPVHVTPCDCRSVPYGEFEIDDCAICLDPTDTLFNTSCLDCLGIPFGTASLDACNNCLQEDDLSRCTADNILFIPNVFSPNSDGINDFFETSFKQGIEGEILEYSIYSRWGELMHSQVAPTVRANDIWWDGSTKGKKAPIGVYVYHLRIKLANGELIEYFGDVTLVR